MVSLPHVSASPGCLWWWCLEGCRITCSITFSSETSASLPPAEWMLRTIFQTSGYLCSPCEEGTHRICINWICYLFCGQELCFPTRSCTAKRSSTHNATLQITGHKADTVCIGHAFFCMLTGFLFFCLHTVYVQCCFGLRARHLRGTMLPYKMHWDGITILCREKLWSKF